LVRRFRRSLIGQAVPPIAQIVPVWAATKLSAESRSPDEALWNSPVSFRVLWTVREQSVAKL
jgi:hypothetical protein